MLIMLPIYVVIPETPRYLVKSGDETGALAVLRRIYVGKEPDVIDTFHQIKEAVRLEMESNTSGYMDVFRNNSQKFRYRTMLSLGALLMQQASGVNVTT